jgi:hypothetical protein
MRRAALPAEQAFVQSAANARLPPDRDVETLSASGPKLPFVLYPAKVRFEPFVDL